MDFYYALLIFIVNMLGLFLWKMKKVLLLITKIKGTNTKASQKVLFGSGRKANEIWVDKGNKLYYRSVNLRL